LRSITLDDVRSSAPGLLDPRGAVLVLAGDVEPGAVRRALEARLGRWRSHRAAPPPPPAPLTTAPARLIVVDRPGAPQTVILAARPAPGAPEPVRAVRDLVNVALGGSFTSRLNQNLREKHGYTYGARSAYATEDGQTLFTASAAVQTEVTGPALIELRRELDGLAKGGLQPPEADKARETARHRMVTQVQTTEGLADLLARGVLEGRPADALRQEVTALARADAALASAEARAGPYGFGGFTVVLVGDRARILPQLEKAGLPAPTFLDPEGGSVKATAQGR
jgi:predicted Zn-dependent peptidase